ncbi:S-inosyl-L-homocysteine hydrolase [Frankliniella fusca]|uniref:S-inosyl-L-homocysteine hydrolase n=1 Tax=Frankliniella fusca TaxID=407009 RepID=A0AAE1LMZ7_9NEOP|nr:S-inosyl-L-homocysteine hydrolase [Frankliniella fusca]
MVRKKGIKISNEKKKRKNRKKTSNRKYQSSSRQTLNKESRNLRRLKQKEELEARVLNELLDGCQDNPTNCHRITDRKTKKKLYAVNDVVQLFGKKLQSLKWHNCSICHTKQLDVAPRCWCSKSFLMKSTLLSVGSCPDVLSNLTLIEQLLIARVHPVIQVYRLVGGQIGYSGHVINFFQDVKQVAKSLPHTIADLKGVVNVCYDKLLFHKDFKIRKRNVLDALLFLKDNNKYYHDIIIDNVALDTLPSDDYFHGNRSNMEATENEDEHEITSMAVPSTAFYHSEEKIKHNMNWPTINCSAVKELTCPYVSQAFPTLFPYGNCDLHEVKDKKMTARTYFQYLMEYSDGRFATHKIFP